MVQSLRISALVLFVLLSGAGLHAQIITTIAGTPGNVGYTGDGGPASAATFYYPSDLAFDTSGNLYITDYFNNVIRKIDTSGIITTIAGTGFGAGAENAGGYTGDGGPATAAELNGPFAIVVNHSGEIIFADGYNHVVRKISTAGIITTIAGNNVAGYAGDLGAATLASLNNPVGVVLDDIGNLYIADDHNNVIREVDTSGIMHTFAGNHTAGYGGDGSAATAASLNDPIGVSADHAGNIYIADADNNVIRKVNSAGIISTFAGNNSIGYSGDGGPASAAQLQMPERVNCDDSGNVYISDFLNNVVRKVNTSGIISAYAGDGTGASTAGASGGYGGDNGPATAAQLWLPQGVAFDRRGRAYIADRGNEVIRRIGPAAAVDTTDTMSHTGVATVPANHPPVIVYPNPAYNNYFNVSILASSADPAEVSVVDMAGTEVFHQRYYKSNMPMRVALKSPPGSYVLQVSTPQWTYSKHIVLE